MERRAAGLAVTPLRVTARGGAPKRRRWWLWLLMFMGAAIVLVLLLSVSRSPAVGSNPPPSAADVRSARNVYDRVRTSQRAQVQRTIRVTWRELAAVAAMAGRAAGFDRVNVAPEPDRMHLQISSKLPLGFWLNGHAFVAPDENGRPRISARVGHLPVPAFVVHAAVRAAGRSLSKQEALPFDEIVKQIKLDQRGLRLVLDPRTRSSLGPGNLGLDAVDAGRIEAYYCRLAEAERSVPGELLAGLVNRAFAAGDGTVDDNRAIFIALALLVAQVDVGALPKGEAQLFDRCGGAQKAFTLQGRADLAKHWTVSAAVTAFVGTDASLTLGTWKEISDSGGGGSGFSLVDLAADRSGAFSAERGVEEARSLAMQKWLAQVTDESLLPVSALALAEGMTEQEFQMRYSDTDSDAYAATVSRIDSELEVLMR